ncbi:Vmc-like lipoprotein signal peptide domain-containing protein [Mycoplasma bradburyae]|uniref:Haemagglutinin Mycoplasma domain-containing protein n=1 Tax=Mycoplasma bradburyae TaxID=2963128 RepID=A0ABT5GBD1_9MOLU|nr:hypothetical protein [Mycoplasma bradburyae]MDC4182299.1 hypothetical protein [Mycoplasma bradburyae]UTS69805.1 hypothetical protein NMG68_02145 [Mycoplasma bradburyae]
MKQKTKKLLQLSFSLGFLATTALVATSCNQPKTVTPKPTNPMQPGNGSGSGTGETMQPGNGSGTGTGTTTTPDNSEAKNQLKVLINKENDTVGLYADYSAIKSSLVTAYNAAKEINNKANATPQELTNAKTALESAVNKAKTDKMEFDANHMALLTAYNHLKTTISQKENNLNSLTEQKYEGIKTYLNNLYGAAETIISNTLQADNLTEEQVTKTNTDITTFIENIGYKKEDADQYLTFKKFGIKEENFKGDFNQNTSQNPAWSIVGIGSDIDQPIAKYAKRVVQNLGGTKSPSDVSWIYSLLPDTTEGKTPGSYDFEFEYYGGANATLYFPYKLVKNSDNSNLSLNYKLNDSDLKSITLNDPKIDEIKVAKITLENLKLGNNKISFTTMTGKVSPMIGNMYISSVDTTSDKVYNDIFGIEVDNDNSDKVTVNFAKGYGLANKPWGGDNKKSTIIKRLHGKLDNKDPEKDFYLVGYLGNRYEGTSNEATNIRYYTFYVNVQKEGNYEISGIYNSGVDRGLSFYVGRYKATEQGLHAKFMRLNSGAGNWDNKVATFKKDTTNTQETYLKLSVGLNKIIVAAAQDAMDAPNLGDVTFTLQQPVADVSGDQSDRK